MRTSIAFLLGLAVCGCGSGGGAGDGGSRDMIGADGGVGGDLARSTTAFRYVTDRILLPQMSTDYATDVNGDGKKENQLGNIVSALAGFNVDLQTQEDQNVKNGDGLALFALRSTDPSLNEDPDASLTLYAAEKTPMAPDFGGSGLFVVDQSAKPGVLVGPLAMGSYQSADPIPQSMPSTVYLKIPLYTNTVVTMPVVGARIAFTPSRDNLKAGQLNGAMTAKDLDSILIPAMASTFDQIVKRMPCDSNCMQTSQLFDTNKDGSVTVDEVRMNGLIMNLLAPDVDLFDAQGAWKPNKANSDKDSVSFGVAFTAVKASFVEP